MYKTLFIIVIASIAGISVAVSISELWLQLLVISSFAMICLPLLILLQRKQIDAFEPIWPFTVLFIFSYGYKAVLILYDPNEFITFPQYFPEHNNVELMLYAVCLSCIGLLAFCLGYFSRLPYLLKSFLPSMNDVMLRKGRLLLVSIFGIIFSNVIIMIFVWKTLTDLNWANMLYNPTIRSDLMANIFGNGLAIVSMSLTPIYALGYYYYFLGNNLKLGKLIFSVLVLIMAALPIAVIGNRLLFLGLLIGVMGIYHYKIKRINISTLFFCMTFIIWAAGALGMMVYPGDYSLSSPYDIIRRLSGTFEFFDHLVTALAHVNSRFWGLTILEDLTITYLPRAFFLDKPLIYGQLRLQEAILPGLYAQSRFSATMAMGILAEGYVNFGLIGVFIVPFIVGIFFKTLYEKAKSEKGAYIIILSFASGSMLLAIRGFGSYIAMMALILGVVWISYGLQLKASSILKRSMVKG